MGIFSIIIFLFTSIASAEDIPKEELEKLTAIRQRLTSLKNVQAKDYPKKLIEYRENSIEFVEQILNYCESDFGALIKKREPNLSRKELKKMAYAEKKHCFERTKRTQIELIKQFYTKEREYLIFQHQSRLKELDKVLEENLSKIEKSYKNL